MVHVGSKLAARSNAVHGPEVYASGLLSAARYIMQHWVDLPLMLGIGLLSVALGAVLGGAGGAALALLIAGIVSSALACARDDPPGNGQRRNSHIRAGDTM
jgi:hypothetical protein